MLFIQLFVSFVIFIACICYSQEYSLKLGLLTDYDEEAATDGVEEAIKHHDLSLNLSLEKFSLKTDSDYKFLYQSLYDSQIPFLIIDVTKDMNSSLKVENLAQKLDFPLISFNSLKNHVCDNYNHKHVVIAIESPLLLLIESVSLIINNKNLTDAFIFYDSYYETNLKKLKMDIKIDRVGFELLSLDMNSFKYQLNQFKKQRFKNIFILAKTYLINLFLEAINQNDMFRLPYSWYAISHGKGKIKCVSCSHATLIIAQPTIPNYHDYDLNPFFSHLNLDNKLETYFYFDATRLILKSFHHLLIQSQDTFLSPDWKYFNQSTLNLNKFLLSQQLLIESETFFGKFGDFKFNNIKNDTCDTKWTNFQDISIKIKEHKYLYNQLDVKNIGYIIYNEFGQSIFVFPSAFESHEEKILNIVTLVQAPFVMKMITNDSSFDEKQTTYYGLLIDLLEEIKKELNGRFPKYEIVEDSEGLYGVTLIKDERETQWNGVVNTIISGADMGLVAMTISPDRELVISFTEPIFDAVGLTIMMKKPERQDHFYKFVTVLESNVWFCIFGSYILTSVILTIFDYYSPYSSRNCKVLRSEDDARIFSLKESLWFCFSSITPQGGGEAPRALSGKLLVVTWWLFGFIVVASYTANLAAFLTVSRLEKSVSNIDELTKQYKIRYSAMRSTSTESYFEKLAYFEELYYEIWKDISLNPSTSENERSMFAVWEYPVDDKYSQIWAQMKEADPPSSLESALKRVKSSPSFKKGYALIGESISIEYLTSLNCEVYTVGPEFSFRPLAFPINKKDKFGLKNMLDPIIKRFKENGLITSLLAKYIDLNKENQVKCEDTRKFSNGISLYNSVGLFIVIAIGVVLSLLALSIETYFIGNFLKKDIKAMQLPNSN